jgi:hypothetical protein
MTSPITISDHSELVAAVPHLLGFIPTDSVVCEPIGEPGPITRVDHPHTDRDIIGVVKVLSECYLRKPGRALVVLAITEDQAAAVKTAAALTHVLGDQVAVATALWVNENRWVDLATGKQATVSEQAATRMAAEAVVRGQTLPAASREELAQALRGDPTTVAALLPAAREHARASVAPPASLMRRPGSPTPSAVSARTRSRSTTPRPHGCWWTCKLSSCATLPGKRSLEMTPEPTSHSGTT